MRIGYISFRLSGTDGVSLETAKIAQVLHRMGHKNFYFAGELDPRGAVAGPIAAPVEDSMLVPQAHFTCPEVLWITEHAFGKTERHPEFFQQLEALVRPLKKLLHQFIEQYELELLIIQNVFAIPMNIALSKAIYEVIAETGIHTISHEHDFYWERERYLKNCIPELLQKYFPPFLPNVQHLVINSQAQRDLKARGFESVYLPNIFDFDLSPQGIDDYNKDLRTVLGLGDADLFFLQPTRVIPRKGIELAIELVHRLADLPIKLIITHRAEMDSLDYLAQLQKLANKLSVDLLYMPDRFQPQRKLGDGNLKIYSLWDAYVAADFVTYPSLYEGFGNALIETLFFRKPFMVNRYAVYEDDIEPAGIQAVHIDGVITDEAVDEVRALLKDLPRVSEMVAHNAAVGKAHFSYGTAQKILEDMLAGFK